MAFHDVRFPPVIEQGAQGGPMFNTGVQETAGGFEIRQQNWSMPRHKWNVGTGLRDADGVQELIHFFWARQGRAHTFLFRDWADHQAIGQPLGAGDGAKTDFQLAKRYSSGGVALVRKLTRPDPATVRVRVDGAPAAFALLPLGVVRLAAAPAAGAAVSADCDFDCHVRFDTDELGINLQQVDIGSWPEIPVVEVRE